MESLPSAGGGPSRVLTVGHSTRPIAVFLELLRSHQVEYLVDVRTVPRSRHNPQFNSDALRDALAAAGATAPLTITCTIPVVASSPEVDHPGEQRD